MQRHSAHRSHLLTAMLFSLVAVGAMCVFVAATSGLHIQTDFLDLHIGPDSGNPVFIGAESFDAGSASLSGETSLNHAGPIPLDLADEATGLVDKTTDLVDEIACPTDSVCLSTVVKDAGLDETVDDLTDGVAGSSLGDGLGETVDEALDADTLGDTVDDLVGGVVEETTDDLLDEVEDIVEDLGDEVEDTVDDLLGGLGLGN